MNVEIINFDRGDFIKERTVALLVKEYVEKGYTIHAVIPVGGPSLGSFRYNLVVSKPEPKPEPKLEPRETSHEPDYPKCDGKDRNLDFTQRTGGFVTVPPRFSEK